MPIAAAPPPPPPGPGDDEDDNDDEDEEEESEEETTDDDVEIDPAAPPPPPLCSYCGGAHANGACLRGLRNMHSDSSSTASRDSVSGAKRKEKGLIDQKAMLAFRLDPFANDAAAAYTNNGAIPPDLSFIALGR